MERQARDEVAPVIRSPTLTDVLPRAHQPADSVLPLIDNADDIMVGGDPIAAFVSTILNQEVDPKSIYRWAAEGLLPVGHFGARLIASKRTIAAHFAAIAGGLSTPLPASQKPLDRKAGRPSLVYRRHKAGRRHTHQPFGANPNAEWSGELAVLTDIPIVGRTGLTPRTTEPSSGALEHDDKTASVSG